MLIQVFARNRTNAIPTSNQGWENDRKCFHPFAVQKLTNQHFPTGVASSTSKKEYCLHSIGQLMLNPYSATKSNTLTSLTVCVCRVFCFHLQKFSENVIRMYFTFVPPHQNVWWQKEITTRMRSSSTTDKFPFPLLNLKLAIFMATTYSTKCWIYKEPVTRCVFEIKRLVLVLAPHRNKIGESDLLSEFQEISEQRWSYCKPYNF